MRTATEIKLAEAQAEIGTLREWLADALNKKDAFLQELAQAKDDHLQAAKAAAHWAERAYDYAMDGGYADADAKKAAGQWSERVAEWSDENE